MEKGTFIALEGIDGSGKSSQIGRLTARLEGMGVRCLATRELYFEAFRRLEGVERVAVVDGSGTQEQVAERIWTAIAPCFSGGTAE